MPPHPLNKLKLHLSIQKSVIELLESLRNPKTIAFNLYDLVEEQDKDMEIKKSPLLEHIYDSFNLIKKMKE
jgi:hypothetical protein